MKGLGYGRRMRVECQGDYVETVKKYLPLQVAWSHVLIDMAA